MVAPVELNLLAIRGVRPDPFTGTHRWQASSYKDTRLVACGAKPAGNCSPAVMLVRSHESLAGQLLQGKDVPCPLRITAVLSR